MHDYISVYAKIKTEQIVMCLNCFILVRIEHKTGQS